VAAHPALEREINQAAVPKWTPIDDSRWVGADKQRKSGGKTAALQGLILGARSGAR